LKYWRTLNKTCGKLLENICTEKYVQMLAASKNQADGKILAANENQPDGTILASVEISSPGEIPVFIEKLAELEKQAACLLFRLGGISNC
jgi:hypothetical protein